MTKASKEITHRSDCPVSFTLDFLGDKWSLLILRDMIFYGKSSYGEFLASDEKIATNILADRLASLSANGFITKGESAQTKSKFVYALTEKGISLLPVLVEMNIWGTGNNPEATSTDLAKVLKKDKEKAIKELTKMLRKRIA
ncbi:winged helix-turn-helix transcriptional regulator [Dyadobacter psychrotolerans]|uniref:Transcriptional regulator n=1 Tax=Dyadobacter psychrotolerans TaxID=2541721 RepID=A0A4R5DSW6_9BACT|nr:helix-turn-helix domain-containing protein [Dyadobacter psychrotolerans]TDE15454.1 transcriptional regulator [Dyadobacter psychrotolerans]